MPVRIYLRGLILFRFPREGDDGGKLVAELISEPAAPGAAGRGGPNAHDAEMQIVDGGSANQLVPRGVGRGARIDITIPGPNGAQRAPNFSRHVPRLSDLAARTRPALSRGPRDDRYVRNTIVVNRGTVRVNEFVMWDGGGFPLPGSGDSPSAPTEVRFLGCDVGLQAANECVLEVLDANEATVSGDSTVNGSYRSVGRRNQRTPLDTLEIRVSNYEPQRGRPVPWGLDYQWLFARLGYGAVNLAGGELESFVRSAESYGKDLLDEDRAELLPGSEGRPFPYIASMIRRGSAATDIYSRPVCVPGDGGDE